MLRHSTHTASFFTVLIAVLIFSLSLAGVAPAQTNTSLGTNALVSNTTGFDNTAIGFQTLFSNSTGGANTANGVNALRSPERAMLVITHYQRLLRYVVPDYVHVLCDGRIAKSGGKELALELEEKGYAWLETHAASAQAVPA